MDKISQDRIMLLHPKVVNEALEIVNAIEARGVGVRVAQGLRTFSEQNNLYAQGRTQEQLNAVGLNKIIARPDLPLVTKAKGGQSWHNYGLAPDIILLHKDGKGSYNMKEDMDKDSIPDWMECVEEFLKRGWE